MTLTREQALENVGSDEVEQRREAERLWLAQDLAYKAYIAAFDARPRTEPEHETDAHPDVAPLKAAFDAASDAWIDFDTNGDAMTGYDDEPVRCALTSLMLCEDDDVVEHGASGLLMLTAALGLDASVLAEDEAADNDDDAENDFDDGVAPSGGFDEGESDGASKVEVS